MASYHFHINLGKRGSGGSHADYVQRTGAYENYKGKEELAHTEHVNIPSWAAHNPSEFFRQADLNERANGSSYREFEFAIPCELTAEQRIEFVRDFVKQEIGADHPCTWAIHQPKSALTAREQPHAHVMFCERTLDGIERNPEQFFKRANPKKSELGGCAKSKKFSGGKKSFERREAIVAIRERFADLQNAYLEKHGHAARVTHLSLEAQGIERLPEKHLGPVDARVEENIILVLRHRGASMQADNWAQGVSTIDITSSLQAALLEREDNERKRATTFERIGKNIRTADTHLQRVGANLSAAEPAFARLQGAAQFITKTGTDYQHARSVGKFVESAGAAIIRVVPQIARAATQIEIVTERLSAARLVHERKQAEVRAAEKLHEAEITKIAAERQAATEAMENIQAVSILTGRDHELAVRIKAAIKNSDRAELGNCYASMGSYIRAARQDEALMMPIFNERQRRTELEREAIKLIKRDQNSRSLVKNEETQPWSTGESVNDRYLSPGENRWAHERDRAVVDLREHQATGRPRIFNGNWDEKNSALEKRIEIYTRSTKSVVDNLANRLEAAKPDIERLLKAEGAQDALKNVNRTLASSRVHELEQLQELVKEARKSLPEPEREHENERSKGFDFGR